MEAGQSGAEGAEKSWPPGGQQRCSSAAIAGQLQARVLAAISTPLNPAAAAYRASTWPPPAPWHSTGHRRRRPGPGTAAGSSAKRVAGRGGWAGFVAPGRRAWAGAAGWEGCAGGRAARDKQPHGVPSASAAPWGKRAPGAGARRDHAGALPQAPQRRGTSLGRCTHEGF